MFSPGWRNQAEGTEMADPQRNRRLQILREAEGYLDLITVYGDQWQPRPDLRDRLAQRALATLARLENPGGQAGMVLYLKGQAYRQMERYGEAVGPLKEAAELESENVAIRLALGWCYKRLRRLDLAIEALEEALAVDSSQAILHYNLACYWSLAGNARLSVAYLAQSFELDSNYRDRVHNEPDFNAVRNHPQFLALTTVIV